MKHHSILVILALFIIALVVVAVACSTPATNDPTGRDEAMISLAAAQGGNLHYQNFVLAASAKIVFTSSQDRLTLAGSDGSDGIPLVDSVCSYPAVNEEELFYIDGLSGGNLAKIGLDGKNQVRIGNTNLKYLIAHDDLLFAIEADTGLPVSLRPDGTGRQILADVQAVALSLADDKLYITGADNESGLIAVDLASSSQERLLAKRVSSLNISGDWLYFTDPDNGFRLTAWSLSKKNGTIISQFSVDKAFIVSEGFLYYIDTTNQNRLYRLAIKGNKLLDSQSAQLVVDDAVASFVVCSDFVYYQRPSSKRIFQVLRSGGQVLRIT
jgi:hypothetical protein